MSIKIEPVEVTEGGKTFKRLSYPDGRNMYACAWFAGTNQIIKWTSPLIENDEIVGYNSYSSFDGPGIVGGVELMGFATDESEGREAFESEIDDMGLIRPE